MRTDTVRRLFQLLVVVSALLLGTASQSLAQVTTVPPGLSPGDPYRLAFVTSTTRNALSSSIAVYNTFVTGVADGQSTDDQELLHPHGPSLIRTAGESGSGRTRYRTHAALNSSLQLIPS